MARRAARSSERRPIGLAQLGLQGSGARWASGSSRHRLGTAFG